MLCYLSRIYVLEPIGTMTVIPLDQCVHEERRHRRLSIKSLTGCQCLPMCCIDSPVGNNTEALSHSTRGFNAPEAARPHSLTIDSCCRGNPSSLSILRGYTTLKNPEQGTVDYGLVLSPANCHARRKVPLFYRVSLCMTSTLCWRYTQWLRATIAK